MEYETKIQLDRIESKLDIIAKTLFEELEEDESESKEEKNNNEVGNGREEYEQ